MLKCILAGVASLAIALSAATADCGARQVKVVKVVRNAPVVLVEREIIVEEEVLVPVVSLERAIVRVNDVRTVEIQNVQNVRKVVRVVKGR